MLSVSRYGKGRKRTVQAGAGTEGNPNIQTVPSLIMNPCQEEKEGAFKDCFKRFFYCLLTEITGRELPWGNLTGIRPTKLAYAPQQPVQLLGLQRGRCPAANVDCIQNLISITLRNILHLTDHTVYVRRERRALTTSIWI